MKSNFLYLDLDLVVDYMFTSQNLKMMDIKTDPQNFQFIILPGQLVESKVKILVFEQKERYRAAAKCREQKRLELL